MKIGVDLGGSHIAVGLINNMGKIVAKEEKDIRLDMIQGEQYQDLVDLIIELINKVLEDNKTDITKISLIGLAIPGVVSDTHIIKASNLGIENFNIVSEINKYYNVPIKLRNDAKCAAMAEKNYGSLKKSQDAIFLTLGTGIGGAVFLNDELLKPKKHEGFEIGHMVIQKDGVQCTCGRKGCFERYASMKALKEQVAKELNLGQITGEEFKDVLEKNKENAKVNEIIDEYIKNLSLGISNLINIFEPEKISIGGSFAYYQDILLEKLKKEIQNEKIFASIELPKIVVAKLKNDAGIVGAVL